MSRWPSGGYSVGSPAVMLSDAKPKTRDGERAMRCFLTISVTVGLSLFASVWQLSTAHAQPNDVRTATTPAGQAPVAPAVVVPAAVVEKTTVAPVAVVAAPPSEVALAGQVLRTK